MAEEGDVIPFGAPREVERPEPSRRSLEARGLVLRLLAAGNGVQRAKLAPARDVKLDALIDCQTLILHALAFLLDEQLIEAGQVSAINFEVPVKQGNGSDKSSPLVTP